MMKYVCVFALFAIAMICGASCARQSQQKQAQLPASKPDIKGVITQVNGTQDDMRIMVEENPADSTGSAKARIRVRGEVQIWEHVGNEVHESSPDALKEGATVSVWYDGPVLMSYPAQGGAKVIVIEQ